MLQLMLQYISIASQTGQNVDRGTRLVHSTRKWPFNFGTHQLIVPALNIKT